MDYKQKIPKFARNHWGNWFYEVLFPFLHWNHPLGKLGPHSLNGLQAKSEICTKPLWQWVLWGPFTIITHKSPPWKTGATWFEWITSKKFRNLHETTEEMGSMRSFFHYYTEITPLENWGHTVWMDYKQQIPKFPWNHWGNGFYESAFPLLNTKHPLGKRGPHSLNGFQPKNSGIFTKPQRQGFMRSLFHYYAQITPLGNGGHTVGIDYKQQIPKFWWNHRGNGFY